MVNQMILPIHTNDVTLENVGGKGANLAKLASGGFPVPGGFLITTDAYRIYIESNQLGARIQERLAGLQANDPAALQNASDEIRNWFSEGAMPSELADQLRDAYISLNGIPVAVRSSATAEDLPEMSFAGQQDTFLNVVGEASLLKAVVDCWSSLWTARAMGYRARNGIPHKDVALSVVVQEMVQAEASGVMFTANPLTGMRTEIIIDATLGLGEALVGGLVEPDHYVIDIMNPRILSKRLGAKATVIRGEAGGGVITEKSESADRQALPDQQILALAELGQRVANTYDFPQDIEWAWAGQQLYLLQSRPITSLFPIPDGMGPDPLQVLFSFASVQGLFDPMTPLGQDAIRLIFAGGASLLSFDTTHETQGVIKIAGSRLWGHVTPLLHHPIGHKLAPKLFSGIDPGIVQALDTLRDDPRLGIGTGKIRLATFARLARFALPMIRRMLRNGYSPEETAGRIHHNSDKEIRRLQAKAADFSSEKSELAHHISLYRDIYYGFVYVVPEIASGAMAGLLPLLILDKIAKHLTGSGNLALEITRGLPNNVTTEMDLILWDTARTIRTDTEALQHFQTTAASDLVDQFLEGTLPETAQEAIATFLGRYGVRGLGEIDMGRPRWREEPAPIMKALQSYLKIEDASQAPDVVFKRGEASAAAAIETLQAAARQTLGGALKARVIGGLARRARALAGLRESPKLHIIRMMGLVRQGLLKSGAQLVHEGVIHRPDDLFFLFLNELEALERGEEKDWPALITKRRSDYQREMLRKQLPRLLLSDGRAFYEGLVASNDEEGTLIGSPVSPGVVEGHVRVVLDPHEANLTPGEIMVCIGTDPSWTPLFLAAGGLIMEVGGMVTHGAIVAREYGIPAVVGVHEATTRLQTGQFIQVDGATGQILVKELEDPTAEQVEIMA
jgi:pyruvate,water dikinase